MESLISGLQHFRKNPTIKALIQLYYKMGKARLVKKLAKNSSITSVYLKSNLSSRYFDPGISDLDFVVIVRDYNSNDDIHKTFKKLNRFYPFIKDHDIYTKKDINFICKYGTTKYSNHTSWELCHGEKIEFSQYFYHPFKFFCDQIDELYFLIIWLFENLKAPRSNYRKRVVKRTLIKIFSVIKWIEEPNDFSRPTHRNLSSQQKALISSVYTERFLELWINYQRNIEFFKIANHLICSSLKIVETIKFPNNFKDYSFSDKIQSESVIVSEDLYRTFYLSGCIDPIFLTRVSDLNPQHPYGALNEVRAKALSISGLNSLYNSQTRKEKFELKLLDLEKINTSLSKPIKFFGTNNLISVSWGSSNQREAAVAVAKHFIKKQNGNFNHLHFSLGKEILSLKSVDEVFIDLAPDQAWHKEALYNFAFYFCFCGDKFIFSDSEVYSEDENWLQKIYSSLDQYDFIHGFKKVIDTLDSSYEDHSWTYKQLEMNGGNSAQGLVWGVTSNLLGKINGFPDHCPDGSNDSLFIEKITEKNQGIKEGTKWYYGETFQPISGIRLNYADVDVIHVNHGKQRLYANRMEVMAIIGNYLKNHYVKNSIGIYQPLKGEDKLVPLNQLFELSISNTLPTLNNLFHKNLIEIPELLFLRFGSDLESNVRFINCLGVVEKIDGENFIKVGDHLGEKSRVIIHYKLKDLILTELRKIRFIFDELIGDNQYLIPRVLINWIEEPYCKNLLPTLPENFEFLVTGLLEDVPLSVEFELNYLIPNQIIRLPEPIEESISMVHSWVDESEILNQVLESDYLNVDLSHLPSGAWYALEFDCSRLNNQPYSAGVYLEDGSLPMTQLRHFSNTQDKYQRIQFFMSEEYLDIKLALKFESENLNCSVDIKVLKRPILNPN